ncbi:TPR repeat-containing protein [Caballeronia temeraria]|uniref:TPR repeat-containing protein n=1 Tax=Caballeronia temeraria TaxID=1777137 RepID=A0A157ZRC9_9BURK|nr:tetratricopeptide repeat protein [Caballeronia temeraria]SAK48046.1 TPR repeat-containing protein [Caballeronia temeraria]
MQEDLQSLYESAVKSYAAGQGQAALHWCERCLSIDPENAEILHLRGAIALALDDVPDAERWVAQAARRSPNPAFLNTLSVIQTRAGAYGRASESARAALESAAQWQPGVDKIVLLYNYGRALQMDAQPERAAAAYRELLELDPAHDQALNNLGAVLASLGEFDAAIEHLDRALQIQPGNLKAHANLGFALLTLGRYKEAWPYFEHRWLLGRTSEGKSMEGGPNLSIPQWKGEAVRADRDRLLILHEQGLGDTLHFCRYIPMAAERFSQIAFMGPKSLRRLLTQSFGTLQNFVYLEADEVHLTQWDKYVSLLSLPLAFGTDMDTIPASIPYLQADAHAAHRWSERLARLSDAAWPRIGLVWAGSSVIPEIDAQRSMPTEKIDKLIAWPHACWISLQKPVNDAKCLQSRQRARIVDWMSEIDDFADTAALVASLDLVICVDTSVAHLAGALGKPVWLLNRHEGCWRWMRHREDTHWYPDMRIFNQDESGDWDAVLESVLAELERGAWRRP